MNLDTIKDQVNTFISKYPVIDNPLTTLAEKTKLEKPYIVIIAALLPILLFFLLGAGHIVIDLVGFVYPLYASIKSIETAEKDDDKLFLAYWIIFCFFKIVEGVADFAISFIPFYFLFKLAFLVWCYHPKTKGAESLYTSIIQPHIVPLLNLDKKEK